MATVHTTLDVLQRTSFYHSSSIDAAILNILARKLLQWPLDVRFIGLDLIRCLVLHPIGNEMVCKHVGITAALVNALAKDAPKSNWAISFRAVANLFKKSSVLLVMHGLLKDVLVASGQAQVITSDHAMSRITLATVIFNCSCMLHARVLLRSASSADLQLKNLLIGSVYELLQMQSDVESVLRAIAAFAALVADDSEFAAQSAQQAAAVVRQLKSHADARISKEAEAALAIQ
eukprot:TRINITY_DN319_c0_g1_i2.p2 TRINITY_DN319_c0_g1~~TRINITY_DN319_c0_g1_i2.p2  ORF type:complete len:233 (-),score=67.28 TRINITY_DN319_c0_g1_i2:38-736(-)